MAVQSRRAKCYAFTDNNDGDGINQDLANQGGSCRWADQASHSVSTHLPTSRESYAEPHRLTSRSSAGMNHVALPSTDQFQIPVHAVETTAQPTSMSLKQLSASEVQKAVM